MSLKSELAAMVRTLPDGSAVSLPVNYLKGLLEADERAGGGPDRLLTLEELAELAGRSVSTVRTWCNSGQIEGAFRLHGREWRVLESAWRKHLEAPQKGEEEPRVSQGWAGGLGGVETDSETGMKQEEILRKSNDRGR